MLTKEYFINHFEQYETQVLIDKYINIELVDEARQAILDMLKQRGVPDKTISEMVQSHSKTHEVCSSNTSSQPKIFYLVRMFLAIPAVLLGLTTLSTRLDYSGAAALFVLFLSVLMTAVILFVRNVVALVFFVLFSIVVLYLFTLFVSAVGLR